MMIVSLLARTIRTSRMNDELSQRRRNLSMTPAPLDIGRFEGVVMTTQPPDTENAPGTAAAADAAVVAETPSAEETPLAGPTPEATKKVEIVKNTIYRQVGGDALPEMAALRGENHDLVGWLTIESVLDLPVVYRDNTYYLTHDFYGGSSDAGTIFLDVNHPYHERTQNLLLHGHNMHDGTMFGRLTQYVKGIDYLKAHPIVEFSSLWRREQYAIFAVLRVSLDTQSDRFFNYYSYPTFEGDDAFLTYVRELKRSSMFDIPLDVQPGDALLTLSTCLDEDRLVIVARRQREGEELDELKRVVRLSVTR